MNWVGSIQVSVDAARAYYLDLRLILENASELLRCKKISKFVLSNDCKEKRTNFRNTRAGYLKANTRAEDRSKWYLAASLMMTYHIQHRR
jgi:hypothetical protein